MLQSLIECPVYMPGYGDQIRVLIEYAGLLRPILWIEFEKDGSLYLGPRKTTVSEMGHGVAHRIDDEHVHVSYSDIAEIAGTNLIKKAKLSFHASGIVNAPMGRYIRSPLHALNDQELLCVAVFEHPKQFEPVSVDKVRKRDVCLRYPVDETRPLWACLYIAPLQKVAPVIHSSATHQITLMFMYPSDSTKAVHTLQLALCHGPEGPWPPYTFLVFAASEPNSKSESL